MTDWDWTLHPVDCPARAGSVYYCECGADPRRARGVDWKPRIVWTDSDGSRRIYGTVRADPVKELEQARTFLARGWRGRKDAATLAASVRIE